MAPNLIGSLAGVFLVAIGFAANFYLLSQWLVYPKQRRRLRVCRPFLAIGWGLYLLGGSVLALLGRARGSAPLHAGGDLIAFIGLALTVLAAVRLLRANAAERRAGGNVQVSSPPEGIWPPPPHTPAS